MCLNSILFLVTSLILCINGNDNNDKRVLQGRYNFNRPPWAVDYNPIPVAIVYEEDVTTGKNTKPEIELNHKVELDSKIKKEIQTTEEEDTVTTKRIEKSTAVIKSDKDAIPVKPKARALGEVQIPVVVVYDSVLENTPNSQQTITSETKNARRRYKQLRRLKQQDKTIKTPENVNPQAPDEFVKTQLKHTESTQSQSQSVTPYFVPVEVNTKPQGKRERDPVVRIVNSENYVFSHNGNFHYSYEGGDGTKAHSKGRLMRNSNDEAAGEAVSGGFSYTDKDGNDFSLSYTADENGYRPIGAHLPTPPPIPPAIARALAYLATATTPEPVTKSTKQLD